MTSTRNTSAKKKKEKKRALEVQNCCEPVRPFTLVMMSKGIVFFCTNVNLFLKGYLWLRLWGPKKNFLCSSIFWPKHFILTGTQEQADKSAWRCNLEVVGSIHVTNKKKKERKNHV